MSDISKRERREKRSVILVLIASFLLFNLYSVATPLFEASDELWHYPFVQHLATGGGLPIQRKGQTDAEAPWRQEGSQPPLYYALAALASAPFDSSNWREIRRVNVQGDMGVPTRDGNANAILHTRAEAFPWTRAALAAHVARLVSVLLSTLTVFGVYLVARELSWGKHADPHSQFRLASMIFTAFVPMFAFISGSINNDNASVTFSTIGLWWALRLVRIGKLSDKNAAIAGLITGLGALSKSSSLGLLGVFGLAAAFTAVNWRTWRIENVTLKFKMLVRWGLVLTVVTALISGWWFVRNVILYGDLLGWTAFLDVVGRRVPPATLSQLWSEREGFIWAYWGVFGTLNVIMPTWIYYMLNGFAMLAIIGLIWAAIQHTRKLGWGAINPAIALCLFFLTLTFSGLIRWTTLTPASQGRLMFPCIAILAAGMAYGLGRIHRVALWLGGAALVAVAIAAPLVYIAPTYAKPADEWRERLPTALNANFGTGNAGGIVELVEASTGPAVVTPGAEAIIQFNWRLTAVPPKNYSVFVHLVDQNNVILAQRDMYPGQGSLALSEHASGFRWTDHYALRISLLAPPPKTLRWRVGVYDFETGQRLKLPNGNDFVEFGQVQLQAAPHNADTPALLYFDNGIVLQNYSVPQSRLRPGASYSVTVDLGVAPEKRNLLQHDENISIQLLDDQARKVAQRDLTLPRAELLASNGLRTLTLDIAKDAAPGEYKLLMVIYTPDDKRGFPKVVAYDARQQFMGDQIELTRLRVE